MLVLTSNGISSDNLSNELRKHMGTDLSTAAIITTASAFHKDKEINIRQHIKYFEDLGMVVELFDLAEQHPKLLEKYDLIFLMGGNPFYLLDIMQKTNSKQYFSNYINNKMVIGASAGSIVFGNTIGYIHKIEPELNDNLQLSDFTGLCLTDIHVFPHTSRLLEHFNNCLEILTDFEKSNNLKINYLEDGQGVFIHKQWCKIV